MRTSTIGFPTTTALTLLAFYLLIFGFASQSAQAQKFKVLHAFHGRNGDGPSELVRDASGNIYGATSSGGTRDHCGYCGTVFKLDKNGKQVWLYSFTGASGSGPYGGLLRDAAGNLFGTTFFGGGYCDPYKKYGCGTVFKLDRNGKKERPLYRFTGGSDGGNPELVAPVEDSAGNLYGTTYYGGMSCGVVFKVAQNGKETVLYTFTCGTDGGYPNSGVIMDSAGNLYGTTSEGGDLSCWGQGCGTVYKVDSTGTETVLHNFELGSGGAFPAESLIMDPAGNLYGEAESGGNGNCTFNEVVGCGTVFKLSPNSDGSWTESTLYIFCSGAGLCADGAAPFSPLFRDASGNLYGTTVYGGSSSCFGSGCGVVFKLDTSGKETVLHSFTGGKGGEFPGGVIMDAAGNLYGGASGGDSSCVPDGCGILFKITP